MKNETRVKLLEAQTAVDEAHKAVLAEAADAPGSELRSHIIEQCAQFGYWHKQLELILNPPRFDHYQGMLNAQAVEMPRNKNVVW